MPMPAIAAFAAPAMLLQRMTMAPGCACCFNQREPFPF
jgi:hypothetical protein